MGDTKRQSDALFRGYERLQKQNAKLLAALTKIEDAALRDWKSYSKNSLVSALDQIRATARAAIAAADGRER